VSINKKEDLKSFSPSPSSF